MKTKTKRKLKHLIFKKRIFKKEAGRRLLRGFFLTTVTLSAVGLLYFMVSAKPYYVVDIHTSAKTLTAPAPPVVEVSVTQGAVAQPDQVGTASWYALGLAAPDAITCASRRFPRGSYLAVTNELNGRVVTCLVNDYGPAIWTGRVIDLSRGSFTEVEDLGAGTIPVEVRLAAAPPVTFDSLMQQALGSIQGYTACLRYHNSNFCNANRQSTGLFK